MTTEQITVLSFEEVGHGELATDRLVRRADPSSAPRSADVSAVLRDRLPTLRVPAYLVRPPEPVIRAGTARYVLRGAVQSLLFLAALCGHGRGTGGRLPVGLGSKRAG